MFFVIAFVHDNFLFEHLNVQNRGLFVLYIALFPVDLSAATSLWTVVSHTSLCCSWFPKSLLLPWSLGCCGVQDSYKIHLFILLIHSLNFAFLTFPLFYFQFLSFYIVIILKKLFSSTLIKTDQQWHPHHIYDKFLLEVTSKAVWQWKRTIMVPIEISCAELSVCQVFCEELRSGLSLTQINRQWCKTHHEPTPMPGIKVSSVYMTIIMLIQLLSTRRPTRQISIQPAPEVIRDPDYWIS